MKWVNKPLTIIIIEGLEKGGPLDLAASLFVGSGVNSELGIARNRRKIDRLTQRIFKETDRGELTDCVSVKYPTLEELSAYFQRLRITGKSRYEHRVQHALDSMLSNERHYKVGSTLALTALFMLVADKMGIKELGAYDCSGYMFPRYFGFGHDLGHSLSYPIRRIDTEEHKRMMRRKQAISKEGIIACLAEKTADRSVMAHHYTKAERFTGYAGFFLQRTQG